MNKSHNFLLKAWYGKSAWIYVLLPLSWLFNFIRALRKRVLVNFFQQNLAVPVVIVGNISIGGTGKTPLIIELVKYLQTQGYKPGVVSRGYGGSAVQYPYLLHEHSTAGQSGDEPLLIYLATGCPVCVAPDRVAAAKKLIDVGCTIILSDDGMQHYALGRSIEIAVVDGQRLFGNQHLLPAGPLREPVSRLKQVDLIVVNSPRNDSILSGYCTYAMNLKPVAWRSVKTWQEYPFGSVHFRHPIHAVAGIGNPDRFFKTLQSLSLSCDEYSFSDHHQFCLDDFSNFGFGTVLMTEKDAVKCQSFAKSEWYSLIVSAHLDENFWFAFKQKLNSI